MRLNWGRAVLIAVLMNGPIGCSFDWGWVEMLRAQRSLSQRDYRDGLSRLRAIVEAHPDSPRALQAAQIGARAAHLEAKLYPLALEFYRVIVLRSGDALERKAAQLGIAQIQFENMLDYDQAILAFEKLLRLEQAPAERFKYRLNLAKCHFQLNDLEQASNELDILLADKQRPEDAFEAKSLRANIMMARHRPADAARAWEDVLKEFPERSQKENVALNLVVCYEDLKEFNRAVGVLERMKTDYPNPDFLNLRIERLRLRAANQPGAQGLKR